jgi:hypothetical protein
MPQVALTEDDEMVETFGFGAAHPNFCEGIQIWRSRPAAW